MWSDFPIFTYIANGIDIVLVWFVIYKLIMVIQGTKAVQLLKGILFIIIVKIVSSFFGFQTLQWIMDQAINWGFIAVIIIFQPELRRALEQLGRGKFFGRTSISEEDIAENTIQALVKATEYLGKRRIGALISIERETGLNDYIETGIPLNSSVSSELLINIFIPNTPLHDGAVIMRNGEITAASCYLPLSESPFISKELGTRHRAAVGISEVTDAITIVVSEETGVISVTKNGELYRNFTTETLKDFLTNDFVGEDKSQHSIKWNWRSK